MMADHRHCFAQRGFSLIEVLVAMLVLGIGILGMIGLQLNAMKFNQTASVRTQASFLAYDMSDRLRANRVQALAGLYVTGLTTGAPPGTGIVATDLQQWKAALAEQLPSGVGAVALNGNLVTITVQWDESRTEGLADQQFVFETEL